jgi:hypothetical protein
MAKKKNSIKKEKIIEVLQQIPEKDLRSFLEKIICGPVVKARFLKEFDAYFINEKSADVYIEQIIGVFYCLLRFTTPKRNMDAFLSTNSQNCTAKCMT